MENTATQLARFNAISDGVLAVIMTIMVLAIRPPPGTWLHALMSRWPDFVSYAVSYVFIGVV